MQSLRPAMLSHLWRQSLKTSRKAHLTVPATYVRKQGTQALRMQPEGRTAVHTERRRR